MQVEDVIEEPLVISPDETVSRTISRMLEASRTEAFVFAADFVGIVFAKDLLKRRVLNPEKSKITDFIVKLHPLDIKTPLHDLINIMLINDYKSLPVKSYAENKIYLLTRLGLLKLIQKEPVLKTKKASDIMTFPYCISGKDTVLTAHSMIRDLKISRLPVTNKNSGTDGVVEILGLLKTQLSETVRAYIGEGSGNKIRLGEVEISSFADKNFLKASQDTPVKEIVDRMIKSNKQTLIIEENGKISGIVTPKDILKLIGREVNGVYVRVSGIQEEDDFIKSVLDEEIGNEIKKLGKIASIKYLLIHVNKHHEEKRGVKRVKYSVKLHLLSNVGSFFPHDHDWDLTKAVKGALSKLEKEMLKKRDKSRDYGAAQKCEKWEKG